MPDPMDPPEADPGEYLEGIDGEFIRASEEFGVPVSILKAVGFVESRWEMVEGQVEFEGRDAAFGTMALRGVNLERAAKLLGVEVEEIKTDRETNIRAAAAVLRDMADAEGIDRDDLGAWAPSIAAMADIGDKAASIAYIHYDVYGVIKNGLVVTDNDGNVISEIQPEPTVEPNYDGTGGPVLATNPDYPGAIFRASPSSNYGSRAANSTGKVRMVIIHSCEGAYSGCWGWLVNPQSKVSAHYVVKEDGSEISQLVKEDKRAFHIAAAYKKSLNGGQEPQLEGVSSNHFTVGIEHAGFAKQASWNANLIEQSAKLVCNITKRQGVPIDKYHVVAHGQLQPNNRIDPGPNWPWATYFNKITAACGGSPRTRRRWSRIRTTRCPSRSPIPSPIPSPTRWIRRRRAPTPPRSSSTAPTATTTPRSPSSTPRPTGPPPRRRPASTAATTCSPRSRRSATPPSSRSSSTRPAARRSRSGTRPAPTVPPTLRSSPSTPRARTSAP
ncbi:N-acetylmuramoyl-L-alanine amidase [Nannocystis pusilla]|uniref:N-acetylmuramoyl-L-alanine amidase n=1 Tax=Nannocystis pusilla TaxID=889268 RepID=UPI003B7B812A